MSQLRFIPVLAMAALLVCGVGGCDSKPTHESVMKDMVGKMKDITTILEGVKDESSAQAAKPKLEAIGTEMKDLQTKASALPKQTPDEEKKLRDKYEPEFKELMPKFMSEMMRVNMDPKIGPIIKDAMPKDGPDVSGM